MEVEDVLMQIRYTGCTWKIDVTHWFQIAFWSLDPTAGPAVSLKCTGAQTTFVIHHVGESVSHIRLYCLSGHFIKDDRQQEIKDNREVNSELCWHTCQSKTPVRVMCYIILVRSDSLLEPALGGPDRNCRFWHFHIHCATISTDPVFFFQLHHCSVTQKYVWANINYAPFKKNQKNIFLCCKLMMWTGTGYIP